MSACVDVCIGTTDVYTGTAADVHLGNTGTADVHVGNTDTADVHVGNTGTADVHLGTAEHGAEALLVVLSQVLRSPRDILNSTVRRTRDTWEGWT